MNTTKNILAAFVASAVLTACGGGGGSSSPASNPTAPVNPTVPTSPTLPMDPVPPVTPSQPVVTNAVDPYTGQPATGTATTTISGMVVSDVTAGAIVTAYAVQPDGSNGAVLGVSTSTGADGKFSMLLTTAPTGMVRLIAKGGSFKSEADASRQVNTALELVTPYITSDLNSFVITPATHILSHVFAYKAKAGATASAAYLSGVNALFTLNATNLLKGDQRPGISILKTVPGSTADTLNSYQDLLTSIEWFGVRYDLPSSVVVRVLASNAEGTFPTDGVDGANSPINVGKWVNGVFDEAAPLTLDQLTALRNPDGSIILSGTGKPFHEITTTTLSMSLTRFFYRIKACNDDNAKAALLTRYPTDETIFADPTFKAGVCANNAKEIADMQAKISTNNRSK